MSPLVGPSTDPDYTKNKSLGDNCGKSNSDMSDRVGGEKFVTEKELVMEGELITEKELMTKEKFEAEKEIKMEDLEGFE